MKFAVFFGVTRRAAVISKFFNLCCSTANVIIGMFLLHSAQYLKVFPKQDTSPKIDKKSLKTSVF
jgi:hypothetical protein